MWKRYFIQPKSVKQCMNGYLAHYKMYQERLFEDAIAYAKKGMQIYRYLLCTAITNREIEKKDQQPPQ